MWREVKVVLTRTIISRVRKGYSVTFHSVIEETLRLNLNITQNSAQDHLKQGIQTTFHLQCCFVDDVISVTWYCFANKNELLCHFVLGGWIWNCCGDKTLIPFSFNALKSCLRGCIQKFRDWVDNKIYAYLLYYSLRSNTKGYGGKTH
jgi:hypothetical protein